MSKNTDSAKIEARSREVYVIEVANGKFLTYFSNGGGTGYTSHLLVSEKERFEDAYIQSGQDTDRLREDFDFNPLAFKSPEDAFKYIKKGSHDDMDSFFEFCASLGGTKDKAFPRVVKVEIATSVKAACEYSTVITEGMVQYGR